MEGIALILRKITFVVMDNNLQYITHITKMQLMHKHNNKHASKPKLVTKRV